MSAPLSHFKVNVLDRSAVVFAVTRLVGSYASVFITKWMFVASELTPRSVTEDVSGKLWPAVPPPPPQATIKAKAKIPARILIRE